MRGQYCFEQSYELVLKRLVYMSYKGYIGFDYRLPYSLKLVVGSI